jgi:hypothetical protein
VNSSRTFFGVGAALAEPAKRHSSIPTTQQEERRMTAPLVTAEPARARIWS